MNKVSGDIWDLQKDHWIVIPVNCVGVMGRGLAKQFMDKYPRGYNAYKSICSHYKDDPKRMLALLDGGLITYEEVRNFERHCFIFFPVKIDWKDEGNLKIIEHGLYHMNGMIDKLLLAADRMFNGALENGSGERAEVVEKGRPIVAGCVTPRRFAIPQLGCGFGELTWDQVSPLVDKYLGHYNVVTQISPDPSLLTKYPSAFKAGWREDRSVVESNLKIDAATAGD